MHPSVFDLDVWADYQMGELRRARRQADLPSPPPRLRIAVAHALIAIGKRLCPSDATRRQPLRQPS